jgi:hypothetical protein
MVFSPATPELGAVRLFPGRTGIPGGNDGVKLVHDNCPKITAETGALVSTAEGEIEKVLVSVGSHHRTIEQEVAYFFLF